VKILVADDETRMRKLVSDFLKREGYTILEAEDGGAALEIFSTEKGIDLVILDVMMPVYDGWTVCREIRKTSVVPIVMLTARSQESDELFGFGLGADEYIMKPFSPMVLVARVSALLKRSGTAVKTVRNVGGLEMDEGKHVINMDGRKLDLSPKEYDLLLYFINNAGVALSRGQILNAVWNYDFFGDTRTVDTHIKKLRIKLKDKADLIQTIRGFGYMFEVK
jgi:two-component system response regulator ResD